MTDEENKKSLGQLILEILQDEENLNTFVFFLNKLENIRRPADEIQRVLNDYLCICEDMPVEGKKRVKTLADRHLLYCKENIGFIDVEKIKIITNAVFNKTGVKLPITIHDFKRKYKKNIMRNDEWSKPYRELMKEYQDGDEIFEMISPRWTWKQLCGRSAMVLIRGDEFIIGIRKSMN